MLIEVISLRLPHQIKAAVAALTDLNFGELSDDPTIKNYVELPTNSSAMVYLMRTGLARTLANIEAEIAELAPLVSQYEEIVFFFLDNLAAQHALPADFTDSSPAGTFTAAAEVHAAAVQHLGLDVGGEVPDQPGLADPGLTADQHRGR